MTLEEAEKDKEVVCTTKLGKQYGIITSKNDLFVFVRYGNNSYSIATAPKYLNYI